jgi:iron(III) transport system permease protein
METLQAERPLPPARPPRMDGLTRRLRSLLDPRRAVLLVVAVIVAYLALVPVGTMIVASLKSSFLSNGPSSWTLHNYTSTFTSDGFGQLVGNSFGYAAAVAVVAVALGFALAWLVARTNTPFKGFAHLAALVPLVLPGILNTVAWGLLISPRTGPLNIVLHDLHLGTFNVYSLAGMVLVQSIHMTPVAFLMGVAAFSTMDSSLEEAALSSGIPPLRVVRTITFRLVRPAIVSALLLIFIQSISNFEVPQLLGVPGHIFVFVSKIYDALNAFPTDYGTVGVIGVMVLVIAAIGVWLAQRTIRRSRAQTITGKNFRPSVTDIGRWRWAGLAAFALFFIIAVVLPVAMLIWSSLLRVYQAPSAAALKQLTFSNYSAILSTASLVSALEHSVILAVSAGVIVTVICSLVAYITVKTKIRGRGLLDGLTTVPIAVPSIILGVGVLYWYLAAPLPFHLYGTLAILLLAFVTIGLPYGLRYLTPAMAQVKDELEEAATASGATWPQSFRRIYLPLLASALLASFLYTMIVAFREISAAVFLYSPKTQVISVEIYNLWSNGSYPVVAALGIVLLVVLAVLILLARIVASRFGVGGKNRFQGGQE